MYTKEKLNILFTKYLKFYIKSLTFFSYKAEFEIDFDLSANEKYSLIFVKKWFSLFDWDLNIIYSTLNFDIYTDIFVFSKIKKNDIFILDNLLKKIYNFYDKKFYFSEYFYLNKLSYLDNLSNKVLIISDMEYYKSISYLFAYNWLKNIFFSDSNNKPNLIWNFDIIILISNTNAEYVLENLNNKKIKSKKIVSLWLWSTDFTDNNNWLYEILKNFNNVEIYPNTYVSKFLRKINKNDYDLFKNKINKKYIPILDQFWHTEKILYYNFDINDILNIDLLINCWFERNYDLILDNYDFFKDLKCVFHNINHENTDLLKLNILINKNNKNHYFFNHLWFKEYASYIINSKIIFIPSSIISNSWVTHATWVDAILFWKKCLLTESNRIMEFKRYNKENIANFETFKKSAEMISKISLYLSNDNLINKSEVFILESFNKDFSIERILINFIENLNIN